jgi:hypothetical protein
MYCESFLRKVLIMHQLAGKIIEAAEKIERRESSHIYFVVMPLFMVGQILAYRGDHLKVTRVSNYV